MPTDTQALARMSLGVTRECTSRCSRTQLDLAHDSNTVAVLFGVKDVCVLTAIRGLHYLVH